MRTIQLSALALVLGMTTVACKSKSDSGDSAATTSGGEGEGEGEGEGVGAISGSYGLLIEGACGINWTMAGSATNGSDLSWSVDLTGAVTDCSGVGDTNGTFELGSGSAYFAGNYVGAATYAGGAAAWSTGGYITGADGGSYYYVGSAAY